MTTRFKTVKSVRRLAYALDLYRQLIRLRGSRYIHQPLLKIRKLERRLSGLVWELGQWSRSHRKLNDGRPPVIDAWLVEHAAEIRFVLDELDSLVSEIEAVRLLDEHFAIIDAYRIALNAAWRLDLQEPEEHERARLTRPPVVRVRWQEPAEVPVITDDDILDLARLLGDVVQEKHAAATAALFAKPVTRFVWN